MEEEKEEGGMRKRLWGREGVGGKQWEGGDDLGGELEVTTRRVSRMYMNIPYLENLSPTHGSPFHDRRHSTTPTP